MKSRILKLLSAVALSLLIAIFVGDLFRGIVDVYAEEKTPELNAVYTFEDVILFNDSVIYVDDHYSPQNGDEHLNRRLTLDLIAYDESVNRWIIGKLENAYIGLNVPNGRLYEIPTGVKISSGSGTHTDPYKMELVYSTTPAINEAVAVGKKWFIGDTINTDKYFKVNRFISSYDHSTNKTVYNTIQETVHFYKNITLPGCTASSDDTDTYAWFQNITTSHFETYNQVYRSDVTFEGTHQAIKGIQVIGGSGTEEDPFTIAPIHGHVLTYSADKATITATCINGCDLKDNKVALTIVAPKLSTEGGSESAEASLTGADAFNAATGKGVKASDIVYYKGDAKLGSAPTTAGDYTAKITVEGATASVSYSIVKKTTTDTSDPTVSPSDTSVEKTDNTPATQIKVAVPKKATIKSLKNSKKGSVTVKIQKKKKDPKVDGYEVVSATSRKKLSKVKKAKSFTKTSFNLTKLKKGKTYYIKVRAFNLGSNKQKIYGPWSNIKKIKVKK